MDDLWTHSQDSRLWFCLISCRMLWFQEQHPLEPMRQMLIDEVEEGLPHGYPWTSPPVPPLPALPLGESGSSQWRPLSSLRGEIAPTFKPGDAFHLEMSRSGFKVKETYFLLLSPSCRIIEGHGIWPGGLPKIKSFFQVLRKSMVMVVTSVNKSLLQTVFISGGPRLGYQTLQWVDRDKPSPVRSSLQGEPKGSVSDTRGMASYNLKQERRETRGSPSNCRGSTVVQPLGCGRPQQWWELPPSHCHLLTPGRIHHILEPSPSPSHAWLWQSWKSWEEDRIKYVSHDRFVSWKIGP